MRVVSRLSAWVFMDGSFKSLPKQGEMCLLPKDAECGPEAELPLLAGAQGAQRRVQPPQVAPS